MPSAEVVSGLPAILFRSWNLSATILTPGRRNRFLSPTTYIKAIARPKWFRILPIQGMVVWLGKKPYPFNVELTVDVGRIAHATFGVTDSETGHNSELGA